MSYWHTTGKRPSVGALSSEKRTVYLQHERWLCHEHNRHPMSSNPELNGTSSYATPTYFGLNWLWH
jgi:hypothetical protein